MQEDNVRLRKKHDLIKYQRNKVRYPSLSLSLFLSRKKKNIISRVNIFLSSSGSRDCARCWTSTADWWTTRCARYSRGRWRIRWETWVERDERNTDIVRKSRSYVLQKIVKLEVRLEHMRMMQIKANITRMRYASMCSDLKRKSVFYASVLKNLEDEIKERENETKRLQASEKISMFIVYKNSVWYDNIYIGGERGSCYFEGQHAGDVDKGGDWNYELQQGATRRSRGIQVRTRIWFSLFLKI